MLTCTLRGGCRICCQECLRRDKCRDRCINHPDKCKVAVENLRAPEKSRDFSGKRSGSGMSAASIFNRSERYGACRDEVKYI